MLEATSAIKKNLYYVFHFVLNFAKTPYTIGFDSCKILYGENRRGMRVALNIYIVRTYGQIQNKTNSKEQK